MEERNAARDRLRRSPPTFHSKPETELQLRERLQHDNVLWLIFNQPEVFQREK